MKTQHKIFAMAAIAALMSACSNDDGFEPVESQSYLQVEIAPESRAILEGTTLPNGSRYAVLCGDAVSLVNYADGVSTLVTPIQLNNDSKTVYALYPADAELMAAIKQTRTLPLDAQKQQDILVGKSLKPVNALNPKATIAMQHVMSRLTFQVSMGTGFDEALVLTGLSVSNQPDKAWIDLDGTVGTDGCGSKVSSPVMEASLSKAATVDMLIVPQSNDAAVLTLTFGNHEQVDIAIPATRWEAGKQYAYDVRIKKYGAEISAAQILTWQDASAEVLHEAVDLGLPSGLLWAACNIGAKSVNEYGSYFSWGDVAPKSEYLMSNTPTYDLKADELKAKNIINDAGVLNKEYDAAAANWGNGWRMPTVAEFSELIEKCTTEWTAINGVYGRKLTGPNGNTLFLPAGGYCCDSRFDYDGKYGSYWAADCPADSPDNACALAFASAGISTGVNPRYYGQNVRAVAAR